MGFLGRGRNCQQSFSGFKFFRIHLEATLEAEKLKISRRKKREKNHQGFYRLWRCPCDYRPACRPRPLEGGGGYGLSDRATDHCPGIFVHSRLVKGPVA